MAARDPVCQHTRLDTKAEHVRILTQAWPPMRAVCCFENPADSVLPVAQGAWISWQLLT